MTCDEFQSRVAELALESLEPGAATELRAHLAGPGPHSDCEAALSRAMAAAHAPGLALDPQPPPPTLWQGIEARIAPPPRARTFAAAMALVAASLIAAVVSASRWRSALSEAAVATEETVALRAELRTDRAKRIDAEQGILTANIACAKNVEALKETLALNSAAVALLEQAGTRVVAFSPQPTHPALKAAALFNPTTQRAMVVATGLPPIAGHDYQLWVIRGKAAPIPAGLLSRAVAGVVQGELNPAALGNQPPDAVAISIEPTGGSRTPTDVAMVAALRT